MEAEDKLSILAGVAAFLILRVAYMVDYRALDPLIAFILIVVVTAIMHKSFRIETNTITNIVTACLTFCGIGVMWTIGRLFIMLI